MKIPFFLAITSAVAGLLSASAADDCAARALSVKAVITADQSKMLEIVSSDVASTPACSCEIVKAAIEASNANADTVAAIVEAAVIAAPEQMRLISQCAVAVAPDALDAVQALLAKLDPNLGDSGSSAKDAKDANGEVGDANSSADEVAYTPNPLDFPGTDPVSPIGRIAPGMPLPPYLPPFVIAPPDVSNINP